MATFKAKVCVVGPAKVGKSVLANFLAEPPGTRPSIPDTYKPTKGVRIVEFTCDNLSTPTGGHASVDVELWDCAGDEQFESSWPAMSHNLQGLIIVVSPENPDGQSATLIKLYHHFIKLQQLRPSRVIVFAHYLPRMDEGVSKIKLPSDRLRAVESHLNDDPDGVLLEFHRLMNNIVAALVKQNETAA